jgi:hypothetical protein
MINHYLSRNGGFEKICKKNGIRKNLSAKTRKEFDLLFSMFWISEREEGRTLVFAPFFRHESALNGTKQILAESPREQLAPV